MSALAMSREVIQAVHGSSVSECRNILLTRTVEGRIWGYPAREQLFNKLMQLVTCRDMRVRCRGLSALSSAFGL